jgi:hypothetical protein
MKDSILRSTVALLAGAALLSSGCAMQFKEDENAAESKPIDCSTAPGDIRVLKGEKAHVVEQIAMGVTSIYPAGLVLGILTGTEGTKIQVATGEYNKMIDKKIAEIQNACGV